MRKQQVKRELGLVAGGAASMRAMSVGGSGSATGAEGETVVWAVTQTAQSGCESVSLPWL
jgi:hypothetical protein